MLYILRETINYDPDEMDEIIETVRIIEELLEFLLQKYHKKY